MTGPWIFASVALVVVVWIGAAVIAVRWFMRERRAFFEDYHGERIRARLDPRVVDQLNQTTAQLNAIQDGDNRKPGGKAPWPVRSRKHIAGAVAIAAVVMLVIRITLPPDTYRAFLALSDLIWAAIVVLTVVWTIPRLQHRVAEQDRRLDAIVSRYGAEELHRQGRTPVVQVSDGDGGWK